MNDDLFNLTTARKLKEIISYLDGDDFLYTRKGEWALIQEPYKSQLLTVLKAYKKELLENEAL